MEQQIAVRVVAADDWMFLWMCPATLKYPPPHSTVLRFVDNLSIFLLKGHIGSFIRFSFPNSVRTQRHFCWPCAFSRAFSGCQRCFAGSGVTGQSILDRYWIIKWQKAIIEWRIGRHNSVNDKQTSLNNQHIIGHFTVVCLVAWPWMQARLEVTLLWYRPLCFSHVNAN